MIKYTFWAKGQVKDSLTGQVIRVKAKGELTGPPGYPASVFEQARAAVEAQFPGIVLDGDKRNVKAYPSLKARKA
jgi:hypothetical protein